MSEPREQAEKSWRERHGLREVDRGRVCQHILRKTPCPSNTRYSDCGRGDYEATDHWRVWQRPDGSRFGLAHSYSGRAVEAGTAWGTARGLVVISDPDDAWYGLGTVPLRYEIGRRP